MPIFLKISKNTEGTLPNSLYGSLYHPDSNPAKISHNKENYRPISLAANSDTKILNKILAN